MCDWFIVDPEAATALNFHEKLNNVCRHTHLLGFVYIRKYVQIPETSLIFLLRSSQIAQHIARAATSPKVANGFALTSDWLRKRGTGLINPGALQSITVTFDSKNRSPDVGYAKHMVTFTAVVFHEL